MKAKLIQGKTVGEIKIALEQSMSDGFKPTLSFFLLNVKMELIQSQDKILNLLPKAWIGKEDILNILLLKF